MYSLHEQIEVRLPLPTSFQLRKFLEWSFIGVSIGIKLFCVFSVLPQGLINTLGNLPDWYWIMIFITSLIINVFQFPIIKVIERLDKTKISFVITIVIMLIGMSMISFSNYFSARFFYGAFFWTSI